MKKVLALGFLVASVIGFHGCGAGSDSAGTADREQSEVSACDCLLQMTASLQEILNNEGNKDWSAKDWSDQLAKVSAPCATADRSPQELSKWSQDQSVCEGYEAYRQLVDDFRSRLVAAQGEGQNMPQDIRKISEEGAKGLLDQLSKQR